MARARQTAGSVSSGSDGSDAIVPLTGNTWTQLNDETDLFYGEATVTNPATCAGGFGHLYVFLDGTLISATTLDNLGGTETISLAFNPSAKVSPGANTPHTLTAEIDDDCAGGEPETFSVSDLKVDVIGTR